MKTAVIALAAALALSGCASLGYYWQSVAGHLALMRAARPVDEWLADPQADAALKTRLASAQRLRAFAVQQLHLPDNASYRRYAEIGRASAVWNLVAAPELSLQAKTWCFPVVGCVAYRGYFSESEARAQAQTLREEGLEVYVYGVPAYSTLGWMNWAGGDPLLSNFVNQGEPELARLLFHEMAHQVVYVKDDTDFNESFATAVERIGLRQWRASQAPTTDHADGAERQSVLEGLAYGRRAEFRALTQATRLELSAVYALAPSRRASAGFWPADAPPGGIDADATRAAKRGSMERWRQDYERLRAQWLLAAQQRAPGSALAQASSLAGYDRWVQGANNAALASLAAYDDLVPAFERLFEREGSDWPRFYAAVRALAASPKERRLDALKGLAP